jgi:hypothetical protein
MALTVADILQVAAPSVLRGTPYKLSPVRIFADHAGYGALLSEEREGLMSNYVSIVWTQENEFVANTEAKRIELVTALLENAMRKMENLRHADYPLPGTPDDGSEEDVIFD